MVLVLRFFPDPIIPGENIVESEATGHVADSPDLFQWVDSVLPEPLGPRKNPT